MSVQDIEFISQRSKNKWKSASKNNNKINNTR